MVSARDKTIALLEEKIHLLLSARFGASSEQVSEAQIGLFNEAEANAEPKSEAHAEIEVPGHRRAKPKRKPLPEHLPRVVVVHDLDEEDKFCPHDGAALKLMSEGMFECSEQFDIVLPRAHQNRPDDGSAHP